MNSICVFCGSHVGEKKEYLEAASQLGKTLAEKKIKLVYGGADVGLMGMVANSCLQNGGKVTGVMPRNLVNMEVAHSRLTELKIVESMHERKALMAELADGFISLPGGIGTLEETLEVLTWSQLGLHSKPIGLLNIQGYYDQLYSFLKHVVDQGFMRSDHLTMLLIDTQEQHLVSKLETYIPTVLSKWADKQINKIDPP